MRIDVDELGCPLYIEGLPPPAVGVCYVVTRSVLESPLTRDRDDLLAPDTGPSAERSATGQVTGVRQLLRRAGGR
jgi:hypothetical protein